MRGHLTAARGRRSRPRCGREALLLVHISDELDSEWARDEAAEAFGGPVEVAREGAVYEV